MEQLFKSKYKNLHPGYSEKFNRARSMVSVNHIRAVNFFSNNFITVNSDNPILTLINSFTGLDYSTRLLYDHIRAMEDKLAAGVGLVSSVGPGKPFRDTMYARELFIKSIQNNNYYDLGHDYKKINAVVVLDHGLDYLEYNTPNVIPRTSGTAVIGIDIAALAIQFKLWRAVNLSLPTAEQETISMFIGKVVLPGLLKSQLDICLRNIYRNISNGVTSAPKNSLRLFPVMDATDLLSSGAKEHIETISRKTIHYTEIFDILPMFFSDTYGSSIPTNNTMLSMYSYWLDTIIYGNWFHIVTSKDFHIEKDNLPKQIKGIKRYISSSHTKKFMSTYAKIYADVTWKDIVAITK